MNKSKVMVVATQGYRGVLQRMGVAGAEVYSPGMKAAELLLAGTEPSWVIGDPYIKDNRCHKEDLGRTLRIASEFKFFAIRDDHQPDCPCGCGGRSIVTLLLPDEY